MTPFLQLILLLAVLLFLSKLAGYISTRLHQPAVLGELMVGLLIGPSLLDLPHQPIFAGHDLSVVLHDLAEIGVLLLMFVAGLELNVRDLARSSKVSVLAGTLGVFFPVLLGSLASWLISRDLQEAVFIGLTLGATSVSISAQTLIELRALRTRVGFGLLGSAVFDDVLVILLMSVVVAIFSGGARLIDILWDLAKMALFLSGSVALGWLLLPKLVHKVSRLPISQGVLTLSLVVLFTYGAAAELLGGMAAITGAFIAGLMFGRSPEREQLEDGISALSYGLFVPLFFINIGLSVNVRDLRLDDFWFTLVILIVAVLGKLLGSGLGAWWGGFTLRESLLLGAGMVSRGEVGLIIATIGVMEGFMSEKHFSVIVAMVIFTTLITPPLLRYLHQKQLQEAKALAEKTGSLAPEMLESTPVVDKESI